MLVALILGAKNVVRACQECKVERLVYNSSADVVFDGKHGVENGDESLPYPWKVCVVVKAYLKTCEKLNFYVFV